MKKIISVLVVGLSLVILPSVVLGQGAEQDKAQKKVRDPTTHEVQTTAGSQGISGSQNRSAVAREKMSAVAKGVEELLAEREEAGVKGGIGQEVRLIAQEQKEAQIAMGVEEDKLASRSGLMKKLFGPDYKAIRNLNRQMERNQLRIEQLEQLQTQMTDEDDQEQVQGVVQALVDQNTALQEQIGTEEEAGSVFGWLFKWFANWGQTKKSAI